MDREHGASIIGVSASIIGVSAGIIGVAQADNYMRHHTQHALYTYMHNNYVMSHAFLVRIRTRTHNVCASKW